jgi:uncharacterized protein YacL
MEAEKPVEQHDEISTIPLDEISSGLLIDKRRRRMQSVEVTITELKSIGSGNFLATLFLGFCGVSLGGLIAFFITITTVTFPSDNVWLFAIYVLLFALSLILSILFGILGIHYYRTSKRDIKEILDSVVETNSAIKKVE